MSCKELIESLRKAADERVRLLWQEAEREAGAVEAIAAKRLEQLVREIDKKRSVYARDQEIQAVSEAERQARYIRLSAEKELSARLYDIARVSLHELRGKDYEAIFGEMARELPALAWRTVRVNPADVLLARTYFPGAELIVDSTITGGMDASTADEAVRIINTFEKRRERAWGDMLPELIKDVYRAEVSDGVSAAS